MICYRVEVDLGGGGYGINYNTPRDVYDDLVDVVGHDEAANVEGWCELAGIGEAYEGDGFYVGIFND